MLPIVYTYDSMNDFSNIISKMLFKLAEFKSQVYAFKVKTCFVFSRESPLVYSQVKQVGAESYAGEVALEGLVPGREYMAR